MSKRRTRTQRKSASPFGTTERTRALTAEFGPKPNFLTWKAYHLLAVEEPDKLRALCSRRPAALETHR
ncbi:hypothetical protein [uncultured Aeromicrobium sp.]|uniref:hypothetical protein n=1 Tax=uncultured Aeromicrobium sp. TaxID=337820 RepID=UPI002600CDB9|nr:hypothetical protein [uncultured Aeromicrobium sp.]